MKKKRTVALLAILLLAGSSYVLGWSTLFTVSSVEIQGTNSYLPITIKAGEKLARVEPRAVAATYERIDFIRKAKVSRNWITGKVTIAVTTRTAIAIYNNQAVDEFGRTFAIEAKSAQSLPRIQAPNVSEAVIAVEFFASLPEAIKSQMKLLKVADSGAYLLEVNEENRNIEVIWGMPTENALKAKVYIALLAESENAKIRKIDLSAPHAPIVK